MITFRTVVEPADIERVRALAAAAGNFSPAEIDVAAELVEERLAKGPPSGYDFVLAESEGETVGYVCYGPIACTVGSYDLYWIVVHPRQQGRGLGRQLMQRAEAEMLAAGARRIYIDTSGRADYSATRAFYERCGYAVDVVQRDFYAPGDDRVIYIRTLSRS